MLGRDTSDMSDASEITIKFTLEAKSCGHGNTEESQARDAIAQVSKAVTPLSSTPAAVKVVNSAVSTAAKIASIATKAQTFETSWSTLLERMKHFNNIVDGIAEVFSA